MKTHGFHPLAFDGEAWTAAACADLEAQTALLDSLDIDLGGKSAAQIIREDRESH